VSRSPASDAPQIKVLLIEENRGDARLILEHIDRLEPALARLREAPADVVLLDLALPDSQGHGTFAAVSDVAPDVPIIVLTGLGDDGLAVRVVQEGAQDFLVKGQVDGPVLGRAIRYAIERQRARLDLRASERRWHAIVASALDAVITMDAAGVICDWNPRDEAVFGWPAAAVQGRLATDIIIPSTHHAEYHRALAQFLTTGARPMLGERIELTALHRDGREFPVELTVTPICLADAWLF
jgi:PAS domain S-box-containing protein